MNEQSNNINSQQNMYNQNNINPQQNVYNQNNMNSQQNVYNQNNMNPQQNTYGKKKNFKKWIVLIGIISLILTISFMVLYSKKNNASDDGISRTIMIYMVGSDLESDMGLGTADLNGIDYDEMDNENINVVLIAGGSKKWKNSYIDKNETSIYELTSSGYKKVKTQSIKNMGDAKVLTDYLNYVYENYESDKYDLIFWNHGAAIVGSESDELSEDNLALSEMANGFKNSKFNNKKLLETVIFRTCLNGTIEIADVFDEHFEYLVASEEVTRGTNVTSVLNFINGIKSTDDGYDIGLKFIESYKKQMDKIKKLNDGSEYLYSTYSIVDLSKVETLIDNLNDFFEDINIEKNYNEISKIRSNLFQYAGDEKDYDMVDLYNLVDGLKHLSPDKAEKVLESHQYTVVYNWATNSKSRGISIYFPYNGSKEIKEGLLYIYSGFDELDTYGNFIYSFYNIQSNGKKSYSFSSNKINISMNEENNVDYDFSLELTEEQLAGLARAEYLVFLDKGDGYYWPLYKGLDVQTNGNILNANINGNALKIIDDESEFLVPLFEIYNDDDCIKYTSAVVLEDFSSDNMGDWKMDVANLTLMLDKKTGKIGVESVVLQTEADNQPSSAIADLNDYQYIAFGSMSHQLLDENGDFSIEVFENNDNGIYEGVEITIDELKSFELSNFNDENSYYAVFRLYDVNNNVYYSKLIKMN